jgi:SAM-dependent methyltransferase
MAKIEIIMEADGDSPRSVECLEVTVWGAGGRSDQDFSIGSGATFDASANFWLEIRYTLQDLPLFYTRNVVSLPWAGNSDDIAKSLEKFISDEYQSFGFGDMLPETGIFLTREKFNYTGPNGEKRNSARYSLKVEVDMGAVFGHSSPGVRMLDIRLQGIQLEEGLQFMRGLMQEVAEANLGRHPDPAILQPGQSDWPFARELNRRAYNEISIDYQDDYFSGPILTEAFDGWLAGLPGGGRILDVGCGHGDPVITRLLEKGFQVTGSDLSPAMLAHARNQFPAVEFWERAITEIEVDSVFDGVCSFSSMLYLDMIDFLHGIHRLYRALKPGGLLFLFGNDLHPSWRGQPYHVDLKQWMWSSTYGMDETVRLLEEHGYFKVLKTLDVTTEDERKERIERWRINTMKEHEMWTRDLPPESNIPAPDLSEPPTYLAYSYIVIAQKQAK